MLPAPAQGAKPLGVEGSLERPRRESAGDDSPDSEAATATAMERAAVEALTESERGLAAAVARAAAHWAGHQPTTGPVLQEEAGQCWICRATFTLTERRHHCRDCGQSVCDRHSLQRTRLPHRGTGAEPQRLCDRCVEQPRASCMQELAAAHALQRSLRVVMGLAAAFREEKELASGQHTAAVARLHAESTAEATEARAAGEAALRAAGAAREQALAAPSPAHRSKLHGAQASEAAVVEWAASLVTHSSAVSPPASPAQGQIGQMEPELQTQADNAVADHKDSIMVNNALSLERELKSANGGRAVELPRGELEARRAAALAEQHEAAVAAMASVAATASEHASTLASVKAAHAMGVAEMESAAAVAEAVSASQLEEAVAGHDAAMAACVSGHEEALSALVGEQTAAAALHAQAVASLRAEHSSGMAAAQDAHAVSLEALDAGLAQIKFYLRERSLDHGLHGDNHGE